LQQSRDVLGHLSDGLTPDSLLQFSTNDQISQTLSDACHDYTSSRGARWACVERRPWRSTSRRSRW